MSSILVDATQQIENMMRMVWGSVAVMCPVALRRCKALPNRSHAIRWMKEVNIIMSCFRAQFSWIVGQKTLIRLDSWNEKLTRVVPFLPRLAPRLLPI